jgi:hypothetical protein
MKAWSVIGLLFGAAILATIPVSPQVTPRSVELSVDQAQAITYGRNRRVNRRLFRRGMALTPWTAALGSPWAYRRAAYAAAAAAAGYYGAGYYEPAYYGGYYGAPAYYGGYGGYYGGYSQPGQPVGGGGGQWYPW